MMKQIIKKRTGKEEKKEKRYSRAKNMEKQSFELKKKREPSNDIDGPNRLVDSRTEIEAEIVEWSGGALYLDTYASLACATIRKRENN